MSLFMKVKQKTITMDHVAPSHNQEALHHDAHFWPDESNILVSGMQGSENC